MHNRNDRPSPVMTLYAAVAIAAVYVAGTQVGLLLTPRNQPVSLLWPPNALLLSALLLAPARLWPWYIVAVLPVHLLTQLSHGIALSTSIGWYFTNVAEAVGGAYCLRRVRPPRELFHDLTGFGVFVLIAIAGAGGLTSFLDAAVVIGTGSGNGYWEVWERRFVSNALATLTLVPPIVMLGSSDLKRVLTQRRALFVEGGLLALGTLVVVELFFRTIAQTQDAIPPLIYTVLPLLFWAAVRFGPIGAGLLMLVGTATLLWEARNRNPFPIEDVWSLQMLLATLSALSMSLAIVVRERERLHSLHGAVLRSIPDAVAIIDPRGVVIETNDAWASAAERMLRSNFVGVKRYGNYVEAVRSDARSSPDASMLVAGIESVLSGARARFDMEYPWRTPEATRWSSISAVPLSGARRGAVITHSDITERKRADAEAVHMRDELAVAGRVMTMGMLSASLTHELSQPLTAVLGNAQAAKRFVERECREHLELEAILTDVIAASNRASSILRHLRNWFKTGRLDAQLLSLNGVVTDVLTVLQADLIHRGVSAVCRLAPDLPDVRGDRLQLQQVVLNLVLNACEAMRHNEPSQRRLVIDTTLLDGRVQLCISDVGTGFPPDRLEAVFEPFVTTKETGLGVGLALCRAIVNAHDGELTAINNDDGPGATVCCTLPCVASPSSQAAGSSEGVTVSPR